MMLAALSGLPGVLPGVATAEEADAPSLAFLEFLGGLVEVEGELVGPGDMVELLETPPVPVETSTEQDWGTWESTETTETADEEPEGGR